MKILKNFVTWGVTAPLKRNLVPRFTNGWVEHKKTMKSDSMSKDKRIVTPSF
jgi:hypothetical protein